MVTPKRELPSTTLRKNHETSRKLKSHAMGGKYLYVADRGGSRVLSGGATAALYSAFLPLRFQPSASQALAHVADMLKANHACEDRQSARDQAQAVIGKLKSMRLTKAAKVDEAITDMLTFYGIQLQHWRRIRTNNRLESIMREIRQRTRVVGAFPDGKLGLMLTAARLRHIAGTQWGTKRYLRMDLLRDLDAPKPYVA